MKGRGQEGDEREEVLSVHWLLAFVRAEMKEDVYKAFCTIRMYR